ncbi:hypothetical protein N7495_001623 [Penicillium taxi]|uniref:uncharacterized protein n=1 Tax=Penicillium taxi TaxID=168475 RepID=UPI002545B7B0|nr:uncharacterized protein N7495_001623 [Penicillium taxi]KAJ5908941.1 hypothetical protein N7495_001623 [Penicillium taxi]
MESLKQTNEGAIPKIRQKFNWRRRWCITLLIAVVVVVIIVIVVPLAVIIPRNNRNRGKASTVLFPAYIYPETNSTWDPLYQALETYPDLKWVVVVNPSSGPGSSASPSTQYATAVNRLSTYSNVQKIGYVRTNYAKRNITSVLADVETYSNWSTQSTSLAMDGIFFDEAPYEYTTASDEYLRQINKAVKSATGLQSNRLIIHNPGTIPDSRFDDNSTDITVTFEQSYSLFETKEKILEGTLQSSERDRYAYILHSMPEMTNSSLKGFVNSLSRQAAYLFLTARNTSYYEEFDTGLNQFCSVVPT